MCFEISTLLITSMGMFTKLLFLFLFCLLATSLCGCEVFLTRRPIQPTPNFQKRRICWGQNLGRMVAWNDLGSDIKADSQVQKGLPINLKEWRTIEEEWSEWRSRTYSKPICLLSRIDPSGFMRERWTLHYAKGQSGQSDSFWRIHQSAALCCLLFFFFAIGEYILI